MRPACCVPRRCDDLERQLARAAAAAEQAGAEAAAAAALSPRLAAEQQQQHEQAALAVRAAEERAAAADAVALDARAHAEVGGAALRARACGWVRIAELPLRAEQRGLNLYSVLTRW